MSCCFLGQVYLFSVDEALLLPHTVQSSPNMSLVIPRSSSANAKRNSARLDLLSTLTTDPQSQQKKSSSASDSPRDSLSPLDEIARDNALYGSRSRSAVELSRVEESIDGESFPLQSAVHFNGKWQLNTCLSRSKLPQVSNEASA